MTRDDIIRMAREAGIRIASPTDTIDPRNVYLHELERFFHAAYATGAKAEREACAEIAEKEMRNTAMLTSNPPKSAAAWDIRNAIRARGEA